MRIELVNEVRNETLGYVEHADYTEAEKMAIEKASRIVQASRICVLAYTPTNRRLFRASLNRDGDRVYISH